MFDSCYKKPENNPRVIQDTNINKNRVMEQAIQRYQNQLNSKKKDIGEHLSYHFNKVQVDEQEIKREQLARKQKQNLFDKTLREQVIINVSETIF